MYSIGTQQHAKHAYQECSLHGTVTAEQARALHTQLEGLSDRPSEQDDFHKIIYTMKTMNANTAVKLAIVKKLISKDRNAKGALAVTLLEYHGQHDTQVHEKLTARTVVKAHVGSNPPKFLLDLGFKQDYEVVMKGRRYRTKQIETTIYKVHKVPKAGDISNVTDLSSHSLVEMTMQVHSMADPAISELLSMAESLKPIVKLEKYDSNRINNK